jgi:hypothetical protein
LIPNDVAGWLRSRILLHIYPDFLKSFMGFDFFVQLGIIHYLQLVILTPKTAMVYAVNYVFLAVQLFTRPHCRQAADKGYL